MTTPKDMIVDPLAKATLTPEQRGAWETMRYELAQARNQVRELENRLKTLEQQNSEDAAIVLTRPEFNREVARMLAFDERYGGASSILYFNFENLDAIGLQFGKAVANAAVREITAVMVKNVRGSDIVGRLAPDEFGVLLVRCANPDAWKKGQLIALELSRVLSSVHGCTLQPQISYGAYTFAGDEDVAKGLKEASQMVTKSASKQ